MQLLTHLRNYSIFFLAILFSAVAYGQNTGTIKGKITDKLTHEGLLGATIYAPEAHKGASADFEGNFTLQLDAGTYTLVCNYIGYEKRTVKNIKVVAGKLIQLNFELGLKDTSVPDIKIVHARTTNTENAVMNEVKKSDNVVSGVSASQIAKSLDRDAAEVIKRVPGVTVIENRFIMVRGLSDRYNNVMLNDASAPSSEAEKKAFSFDIIPSSLVDRIMIYKAASPELPGDFAGGMVKVYTTEFPSKRICNLGISTSYRPGSTLESFYSIKGSSTDWLGFDNGTRAIPYGTPERIQRNADNNTSIANSFKDEWKVRNGISMPDLRLNSTYMNSFRIKGSTLGWVSGLTYSNTSAVNYVHRTDYDSSTLTNDYTDQVSTNTARIGVLENVSLLKGNNRFTFKNIFNQIGSSFTTLRTSNQAETPLKAYEMGYSSRSSLSSEIGGRHNIREDSLVYNWTAGYSYTYRNDPDLRRLAYSKSPDAPDSMYKAMIPSGGADPNFGGGRIYRTLSESVYSFSHNINYKFNFHSVEPELNAGNYFEYRDRSFNTRVLGMVIQPGARAQQLERLPIDQIFNPANFGSDGFHLDEITNKSDAYQGQNTLLASYGSLSFKLGKFKVLSGVRAEYNIQSLQSYLNTDAVNPSVTTFFILPSANLSYHLSEKKLLRLAYGKTLNRPEFREWSPFKFYDFSLGALTNGSLFSSVLYPNGTILKVAEIQNFDFRYELYPSQGETVQFGAFYKYFTNPIEQVILVSSGDSRTFSFSNANNAYTTGIEVDVRKLIFRNISVVANASLIKSQVTILHSINQEKTRALQGQSPYVFNAGFYYQDSANTTQFSLLYNVFGPRIFVVGSKSYASIGELPIHSLDLTITHSVSRRLLLTFGAQNILNQEVKLVQDTNQDGIFQRRGPDTNFRSYKPGSYFSLGLRVKL